MNFDSHLRKCIPLTFDYLHMIESSQYSHISCKKTQPTLVTPTSQPTFVTQPTLVTLTSQTIKHHILTNDSETFLTPGVIRCKISDPYPICCIFTNSHLSTDNAKTDGT